MTVTFNNKTSHFLEVQCEEFHFICSCFFKVLTLKYKGVEPSWLITHMQVPSFWKKKVLEKVVQHSWLLYTCRGSMQVIWNETWCNVERTHSCTWHSGSCRTQGVRAIGFSQSPAVWMPPPPLDVLLLLSHTHPGPVCSVHTSTTRGKRCCYTLQLMKTFIMFKIEKSHLRSFFWPNLNYNKILNMQKKKKKDTLECKLTARVMVCTQKLHTSLTN